MNASQVDWGVGHEQSNTSAFMIIHQLLRGRYILTISLALVFGIVGGGLGYTSQKPLYKSTGIIRIQPSLPKVLYESEQSTATSMFSSFVNSQAELISNGGVIQRALESDEWRAIKNQSDIQTPLDVQDRLEVKTNRTAQEIIKVSFSDENPRVAAVLVDAIMESYREQYGKEGSINNPEIISALKKRQSDLYRERDGYDNQIAGNAQTYGTMNLAPLIEDAQDTVRQLEAERKVFVDQKKQYTLVAGNQGVGSDTLTIDEAAGFDPMIADLLSKQAEITNTRDDLMSAEGLREGHRDVKRLTGMIESLQQRIDARLEELRTGKQSSPLIDENGVSIPSEEVLAGKIAQLDMQIRDAKNTSDAIYNASIKLDTLKQDRETVQNSITQVTNRLDQINTESQVENMKEIDGKISILFVPTPSKLPSSDPRRKLAIMGFVGMSSLPIMGSLGLGFFSHRVRYSDDDVLSGAGSGIIGMLPDLGDSLADQDLAAASAFAVHQIRSQLQIKNRLDETRVYSVTSPAPQDGKTSFIIAIGLSYAESGDRTLLVDLDFIGRGLSIHFGHPDERSLAEALESPEQIDSQIFDTEFDGLSILPAGFGDDELVSRLSPRSIGGLIDHLRENYDTILIDSGPILGSVEAAFVAPQADGVLMLIGRGQFKPLIRKAIDQVNAVDGTIVATIFNRASSQDLRQSSSSMSVHFSRQMTRQQEVIKSRPNLRVGPVAGALFSSRHNHTDPTTPKSAES